MLHHDLVKILGEKLEKTARRLQHNWIIQVILCLLGVLYLSGNTTFLTLTVFSLLINIGIASLAICL